MQKMRPQRTLTGPVKQILRTPPRNPDAPREDRWIHGNSVLPFQAAIASAISAACTNARNRKMHIPKLSDLHCGHFQRHPPPRGADARRRARSLKVVPPPPASSCSQIQRSDFPDVAERH